MRLRLLYLGNFLSGTVPHRWVCEDLAEILSGHGHRVAAVSHEKSRLRRLGQMLSHAARGEQYDLALLDLYSGLGSLWAQTAGAMVAAQGKPLVVLAHGGGLPEFCVGAKGVGCRRLLGSAAAVVTPSGWLARRLAPLRPDITVIGNPVRADRFRVRARPLLQPRLCWVRALAEVYDPAMAVRALARIAHRLPMATLDLYGRTLDIGTERTVRALIRDLGLSERATLCGALPYHRVPSVLDAHDIFLNTTRVESFGVSVAEAALSGLGVVTTNAGALGDLWRDGRNARVVDCGDAEAMGDAVVDLVSDPLAAGRLSRAAQESLESFSPSRVADAWETLFRRVLQGGEAAP